MISFQLKCSLNHEFEAWFRSSDGFEEQRSSGDVSCPVCGDAKVEKALMAPNVAAYKGQSSQEDSRTEVIAQEVQKALDMVRNHVEDNCDYVGDQFADEARRIHYGETEERGIYGEATQEESKELDEEGIEIVQMPLAPRRNS